MNEQDHFLSEFTPLPRGIVLPNRILAEYEADSCLGNKEGGRLILRLRQKSDGRWFVLKAAAAEKEDLAVTDFSPLSQLPALGVVVVPQEQGTAVETDCPGHTFELRTY